MFQKFYTDTLFSRYIKSLLSQTPVPLFDPVFNGDYLTEGCYYVYKQFIIQCISSGNLNTEPVDALYPGAKIFPGNDVFPKTKIVSAGFKVITYLNTADKRCFSTYTSSTNYYDAETHYHLGRYLRYVKSQQDIDLFPYYNCYNSTYFSDTELSYAPGQNVKVIKTNKQSYKVVAIPILFGHTYTVAIDCPTQVLMRACIRDNSGYVDESMLHSELKHSLSISGKILSSMSFNSPVEFRIENKSFQGTLLQKNLYLVIQLPSSNKSSIVVLENYIKGNGVYCDKDCVREFKGVKNPSLLFMNSENCYAFSDRLVEYLLTNVITPSDVYAENIAKIQTSLCNIYPSYAKSFLTGQHRKGLWDEDIKRLVLQELENRLDQTTLFDQDGYINRDVESFLTNYGGIR